MNSFFPVGAIDTEIKCLDSKYIDHDCIGKKMELRGTRVKTRVLAKYFKGIRNMGKTFFAIRPQLRDASYAA